jgi:hypothetical protein
LSPWNVDTISHEGFSKTRINKPVPRQTEELSEEEKEKKMKEFVKQNESDLKVRQSDPHFFVLLWAYESLQIHNLKEMLRFFANIRLQWKLQTMTNISKFMTEVFLLTS